MDGPSRTGIRYTTHPRIHSLPPKPVGQPVFSRRPARFSAWLAGWPAGRLAVAARPGQPAAPRASRRLSRARPATPLETRPAAGHIRAGLNSSRPSPPAARLAGSAERLAGSAERLAGSAERLAGSAEPRRLGGQPDLGLGRPGGRPDLSGGPAGFGPRPAGWPAGFFGRPSRIWAVGRPVLGGRPAGFGGSAGRVGRAASRSPLTAQPPLTGHRFLVQAGLLSPLGYRPP